MGLRYLSKFASRTKFLKIATPNRKLSLSSKIFGSQSYENGVYKSIHEDVVWPEQDICSTFFSKWEKWEDKVALESIESGQKVTYKELREASLRWGAALRRMKLNFEPDEVTYWNKVSRIPPRVAILSSNVVEYIPAFFGSVAAGFCFTAISPNYKVGEVMNHLKDTKPEVLVVHPGLESLADEALRGLKMDIPVFSIGSSSSGKPNIKDIMFQDSKEDFQHVEMRPSDVALILYSSGTTGLPKGVALTHTSAVSNCVMFTGPKVYPYGPETDLPHETVMGLFPYYHVYGIGTITVANLFLGSKILVWENLDPSILGSIIKDHKLKFLHLVPTLLNFIVKYPIVSREDLSELKGVIIASAPVLPSTAMEFKEKAGKDISFQECFGMTEVCGTTMSPLHGAKIGYAGQLVPNIKAKIVDLETRKPLGPGEKGELLINTPSRMSHYLNNPEATYETVDDEGYLKTGDVAVATEDGYFKIVDRLKELIKVKGLQVSPAEIESVLMEHPAVAEAGVVGVTDERMDERPRAYVTLKGEATAQELAAHVKSKLASYKQLTGGVVFLDDLPKSQAGKILRKELKELALKDADKLV